MNGPRDDGVPQTDWQGFLAAAAVAALGGCSEVTDAGPGADGEATPDGQRTGGETFDRARAGLETVYGRLEAGPVAADGEFVFDVGAFESEFDHEAVVADAAAVRDRLEAHDADGAAPERDALAAAAEPAGLLARQRLFLHQAVAAGVAFEERFARAEFGPAAGAVRDARAYVDRLVSKGERIEAVLVRRDGPPPAVDGYGRASVRESQSVLVEVSLWTGPAYNGLARAADGFDAFAAPNDAMERERFGTAAGRFGRARESDRGRRVDLRPGGSRGRADGLRGADGRRGVVRRPGLRRGVRPAPGRPRGHRRRRPIAGVRGRASDARRDGPDGREVHGGGGRIGRESRGERPDA